jgi:hypothetical protein
MCDDQKSLYYYALHKFSDFFVLFCFVLSSHTNTGLQTIKPLGKTFAILLFGISFYAIVGVNLFKGRAYDADTKQGNLFGAACLVEAGDSHPFKHFGTGFVSMYVLATTDNFANIMWPFYTCSCKFEAINGTDFTWATTNHCGSRRAVSSGRICFYLYDIFLVTKVYFIQCFPLATSPYFLLSDSCG